MKQQQLQHWLTLNQAYGIGPRKFAAILENFPNLGDFFSLSQQELRHLGLPTKTIQSLLQPATESIGHALDWATVSDQHIIKLTDPNYPSQLLEIADPPPLLYCKGDISLLKTPQIAIIGSRRATKSGIQTAYDFAKALAESGYTITSGMALGIDSASHQGALQNRTIAVMGTGMGHIYPPQNRNLWLQIAQQGLILSEFPINTPPRAEYFPRRNRIISGLSIGIVVVEAAIKSGSLITAKLGLEQGREIFAIPGSIHNPQARGCHALIKQGAKLVEQVSDILEELGHQQPNPNPTKKLQSIDNKEKSILNCVDYQPTSIDSIVTQTGLTSQMISTYLIKLELKGYIMSTPGGYQRIH